MRILLIGGGGREHALAWKLSQSPLLSRLDWAPGNGAVVPLCASVPIAPEDVEGLVAYAAKTKPDLVVVGPEVPLALGISDLLAKHGIGVFGPSRKAARLESSKLFAKEFCKRHDIPASGYWAFNDAAAAVSWLSSYNGPFPVVLKADGLAAGKGVLICKDAAEARAGIVSVMEKKEFGPAGETLVVEEFLRGEEVSVLAFCDGKKALLMPPARDYKRALDRDEGLNTGGMGAYCPSARVSKSLQAEVVKEIMEPVLRGMAEEGADYRGVLYAGLMLTDSGPKVLEFNCRFGDPETQAVLPRISSDLLPVLMACARGDLSEAELSLSSESSVVVALCSEGYPGHYPKGREITGLAEAEKSMGVLVFHAGTKREGGRLLSAGGRVINVVALASDVSTARRRAYEAAERIRFEGMHYRKDIAENI